MNIDWKKYKRLFTFGCSFTAHTWPSWADIISNEMPNAEFYNLGKSGAGNLMISSRIAEANNRFKFNEHDLVMVMYSTYSREDRWVNDSWLTLGNIYNQSEYSAEWVRRFADERGYLIRDLSLIDLSVRYLDSLPCDSYKMLAVPLTVYSEFSDKVANAPNDVVELYKETLDKLLPPFSRVEMGDNWETEYKKFSDGHPSTIRYYNYLKKIGFNLSPETEEYARVATEKLCEVTDKSQLAGIFVEQDNNITNTRTLMF